jgi:hypothetical protein
MTPAVTLIELLAWNDESAAYWNQHLAAHPELLELPCGIGGAATVQQFVRHIWGVELRWAQLVAELPVTVGKELPTGPLVALYGIHVLAAQIYGNLLKDPVRDWERTITLDIQWLPEHLRTASRRKLMAHGLVHSQRHWAQLATLVRAAGFPSEFKGDLLFSPALA